MFWFKKRLDWSKFTKQPEPDTTPPPAPEVKYPYEAKLYRSNKLAQFQTYTLDVTMIGPEKYQVAYAGMQINLLQDIRDQLGNLIHRFDILVEGLNNQVEPDTIECGHKDPKDLVIP